jgi:hypothetical protein
MEFFEDFKELIWEFQEYLGLAILVIYRYYLVKHFN